MEEIYFIQAENGPIKIGRAVNVERRLAALQVGSPVPLKLMTTAQGTFRLERQLHDQFNHLRLHGEWFRPDRELMALIERIVSDPAARVLPKNKAGAKGGPQPRLRARILMLMRAADVDRTWRPYQVAKTLGEGTDDCGRIMRSAAELERVSDGHYRLRKDD